MKEKRRKTKRKRGVNGFIVAVIFCIYIYKKTEKVLFNAEQLRGKQFGVSP